ncbi:MAG: CtrA inhibitor SciP [Alphaproteobacteria bacterium]
MSNASDGASAVIGPAGEPMTLDDLPPPTLKRWITRRKAEVVTGVRAGLIGLDEACRRYGITSEEFLSWQHLLEDHGLQGLRTTRLRDYRGPVPGAAADGARPAVTEE